MSDSTVISSPLPVTAPLLPAVIPVDPSVHHRLQAVIDALLAARAQARLSFSGVSWVDPARADLAADLAEIDRELDDIVELITSCARAAREAGTP